MDSASVVRPSKRDLDEDEKYIGDQPALKSVKAGEVVPSSEVAELQKKLHESQAAFHAEKKRAEELEAKIDLSSRMEDARRRAESTVNLEIALENNTLKTEMADIRTEHQTRLAEVSAQLEESRRKSESAEILELKNETLQKEMEKMRKDHQKRIDEVTQQLKDGHQERINDLMQKLAQYENVAAAARSDERVRGVELHRKGDPTNILQMCHPHSSESTSFRPACDLIHCVAELYDSYYSGKRCGDRWLANLVQEKSVSMYLECWPCQDSAEPSSFGQSNIIRHFLSKKHYDNMRALSADVSTAALEYWMDILKPMPDVMEKLQKHQQQRADAAVTVADHRTAENNAVILKHYSDPRPQPARLLLRQLKTESQVIARLMQQQAAASAEASEASKETVKN